LSRALGPDLAKLTSNFQESRARLTKITRNENLYYSSEELLGLLGKTAANLREILKDPRLAATRDAVDEVFQEAKTKLIAQKDASISGSPPTGNILAAGFNGGLVFAVRMTDKNFGRTILKQVAEASLDLVQKYLIRLILMAEHDEFSVDLCVTSRPTFGAHFSMRPPSYHEGIREVQATNDKIHSVARGLYAYQIRPASGESRFKSVQCGWEAGEESRDCINLLKDPRTTLTCDLAQGFCRLTDDKCP